MSNNNNNSVVLKDITNKAEEEEVGLIREVFVPVHTNLRAYGLDLLITHFDEWGLERGSSERRGFCDSFLNLSKINHEALCVENWSFNEISKNAAVMSGVFYGLCCKLKSYTINAALFMHVSQQALMAAGGRQWVLARRLYQLPYMLLVRNLRLISIEHGYPNQLSNARGCITCNVEIPVQHTIAKARFYYRVFERIPVDVIKKHILPFLSDSIKYEQALTYFVTVYRGLKLRVIMEQLLPADGTFNAISVSEQIYNIFWYRYNLCGWFLSGNVNSMGNIKEYREKIRNVYNDEVYRQGVAEQRRLLMQCQKMEDTMQELIEKSINDYIF